MRSRPLTELDRRVGDVDARDLQAHGRREERVLTRAATAVQDGLDQLTGVGQVDDRRLRAADVPRCPCMLIDLVPGPPVMAAG